ncbi:hypothetical protein D1872_332430 [compost metagenome]
MEVAAGLERAFFDQQHLETGSAEQFGTGGTAGAAADDDDIGFQAQVVVQARGVTGFPAAAKAFAKQVGYGHLQPLVVIG